MRIVRNRVDSFSLLTFLCRLALFPSVRSSNPDISIHRNAVRARAAEVWNTKPQLAEGFARIMRLGRSNYGLDQRPLRRASSFISEKRDTSIGDGQGGGSAPPDLRAAREMERERRECAARKRTFTELSVRPRNSVEVSSRAGERQCDEQPSATDLTQSLFTARGGVSCASETACGAPETSAPPTKESARTQLLTGRMTNQKSLSTDSVLWITVEQTSALLKLIRSVCSVWLFTARLN